MKFAGSQILADLTGVPWEFAARVYGNDHATLIGLLVSWWVGQAPTHRWAIEGGPTNGYRGSGKRGQCDALLCENESPVGVLEVEGSRFDFTIKKISRLFDGKYAEIRTFQFAILLLYTYEARGRGKDRGYDRVGSDEILQSVARVSKEHRAKSIVVVTLDKTFEREVAPIRRRNEYYRGAPSHIEGRLFVEGRLAEKHVYFRRLPHNPEMQRTDLAGGSTAGVCPHALRGCALVE